MTDGHMHLERGPYTMEWFKRFVDRAVETGMDEIRVVEHNHCFPDFAPMYDEVCARNAFQDAWFKRQLKSETMADYLEFADRVRQEQWPVRILFGLEVCYFREWEDFIREKTEGKGLDFLLGSEHFVEGFAYDHSPSHWEGLDVDHIYEVFFEDEISLARSGIFDGIGHPDAIKLYGHRPSFPLTGYYERLAAELKKSGMYADQNSGIYRRCSETSELGMDRELLHILKKHGVPIVTSSDAHTPEDVGFMIWELVQAVEEA